MDRPAAPVEKESGRLELFFKRIGRWIKAHWNEEGITRLVFWLAFLSSFALIFFGDGVAAYTMFYVLLATVLLSFVQLIYVSIRIKYFQSLPEIIINKGEAYDYSFRLTNVDPMFYSLIKVKLIGDYSIFEHVDNYEYILSPFQKMTRKINVDFKYRGVYEFGVDHLEISDFLGLFRWVNILEDRLSVIIYPRVLDIQNFRPIGTDQMTTSLRYLKNNEEVTAPADIRHYQYGDPLNRIHWKLFARTGEMLTKIYESGNRNSVGVFVDLTPGEAQNELRYAAEDRAIETSISLIRCFLRNQMPVHMIYGDRRFVKTMHQDNIAGFGEIYELLSRIRFDSRVNFFSALERRLTHDDNYQDMLVVTIDLSRAVADRLLRMSNSGRNMTVINILSGAPLPGGAPTAGNMRQYGAEELRIYSIPPNEELRSAIERLV